MHDAACLDDSGRWGGTYVAKGSTVNATGSGITSCGDAGDVVDVWYTYGPDFTADVTITVDGSGFDTSLAIFDGCGGSELDCNDDQPSSITMTMTAGVTYWIRVAGLNGTTGSYSLNVTGGGRSMLQPT